QEGAVQGRRLLEPGVGNLLRVPHVHVRVENRHALAPLSHASTPATWATVSACASFASRSRSARAIARCSPIVRATAPDSVAPRQKRARTVGPDIDSSRPARYA